MGNASIRSAGSGHLFACDAHETGNIYAEGMDMEMDEAGTSAVIEV